MWTGSWRNYFETTVNKVVHMVWTIHDYSICTYADVFPSHCALSVAALGWMRLMMYQGNMLKWPCDASVLLQLNYAIYLSPLQVLLAGLLDARGNTLADGCEHSLICSTYPSSIIEVDLDVCLIQDLEGRKEHIGSGDHGCHCSHYSEQELHYYYLL